MGNSLIRLEKRIRTAREEELCTLLGELANESDRIISSRIYTVQQYQVLSDGISKIGELLHVLSSIKAAKTEKLMPLIDRYLDLEGMIKEIRNDVISRRTR